MSSNTADFAFLCLISVIFGLKLFHSPECSPCKSLRGGFLKSENSALRWSWSETNSSGCHILGSAMKNKSQCHEFLHMSWTSHRPCRWQCALVYLTIPGHKWQVELIGNFILNLTETLSQEAWNYRFSSGDCEYSNIRTWYLLPFYQCLLLDLQYKVFLSLFLIHIWVLNFLKPKSEEKFIIKERDLASLETWSGLEKKFVGTLKVSNSLHF